MHGFPGRQRVERRAEAEHVRARVHAVALPAGLLRRHERGGAEGGPRRGALASLDLFPHHAGGGELGDAQLALFRQDERLGSNVAVNDALVVGGLERVAQGDAVLHDVVGGQEAAALHTKLFERLALHHLEGDRDRSLVGHAVAEDAHDAGVLDAIRDVGFALQARDEGAVVGLVRVDDLDVHLRAGEVLRFVRGELLGHADDALDLPLSANERARFFRGRPAFEPHPSVST